MARVSLLMVGVSLLMGRVSLLMARVSLLMARVLFLMERVLFLMGATAGGGSDRVRDLAGGEGDTDAILSGLELCPTCN